MNLSTSALIGVDVQNGFVRDRSRHVVPVIVELVEEWKNAGGTTRTGHRRSPRSPATQYSGSAG